MKHKVTISVTRPDGIRSPVVHSGTQQIPRRLLNWLLGDPVGLIVIAPGESVETVEIRELKEGDPEHEQNQAVTGCCRKPA